MVATGGGGCRGLQEVAGVVSTGWEVAGGCRRLFLRGGRLQAVAGRCRRLQEVAGSFCYGVGGCRRLLLGSARHMTMLHDWHDLACQ
jgi:hypothetical protein